MVDFDKLNTIDDWENLGINVNPVSHKDWTIQDLLIARDRLNDLIKAIPDSQKYSIFNKDAANSDYVRLLLLRSAFENALSNHKQNTALWAKDPHLNEYTSKAEDYDGNTYIADDINNLPNDPNAEDNDWRTDQMKALSGEDWEEDTEGTYKSREEVPEQARELWDILHNDEAINSMKRGM